MPTLKADILAVINAEYPYALTNQQLATRLDANEPSVRRAVKELERAGHVAGRCYNYETGGIEWKAIPVFTSSSIVEQATV